MLYSRFNTIITFDLHDVVFKFDYKKIFHLIWTTDRKWAIFTTIAYPRFIWNLLKLLYKKPIDHDIFEIFSHQRPILLPLAIEIMNATKIIGDTAKIIKELDDKGYYLDILTNATDKRFIALQKNYPDLLSHFRYSKKITKPSSPDLRKPHEPFFREYLERIKDLNKTDFPLQNILFIDDNKKNIKTAQKVGMNTIRFKSPQQLREALVELRILP